MSEQIAKAGKEGGQAERLAKRVAQLFACSRREALAYIEGGFVTLDGQVCEEAGSRVLPTQQIALLPGASCADVPAVTFLWHKPAGLALPAGALAGYSAALTGLHAQTQESQSMPGAARFLRRHLYKLDVCAALDESASGLCVLTQDWHIARKLREDGATMEQEFVLEVAGLIEPELRADYLNQLLAANQALKKPLPGLKLSWQNEIRLRCVCKGGLQGEYAVQIGQIFARMGWRVQAMRRIRLGRIAMAGMALGNWRYLRQTERF